MKVSDDGVLRVFLLRDKKEENDCYVLRNVQRATKVFL